MTTEQKVPVQYDPTKNNPLYVRDMGVEIARIKTTYNRDFDVLRWAGCKIHYKIIGTDPLGRAFPGLSLRLVAKIESDGRLSGYLKNVEASKDGTSIVFSLATDGTWEDLEDIEAIVIESLTGVSTRFFLDTGQEIPTERVYVIVA